MESQSLVMNQEYNQPVCESSQNTSRVPLLRTQTESSRMPQEPVAVQGEFATGLQVAPGNPDNTMQTVSRWPSTRNWGAGSPGLFQIMVTMLSLFCLSAHLPHSSSGSHPALYLDPMYGRQCMPTDL